MGKNKLAKFADMEQFPHVFQVSSHAVREGVSFEMKGKWNELFFKNDHPIVLELGCGKGEYTVGLCQLFPEKTLLVLTLKVLVCGQAQKNRWKKG